MISIDWGTHVIFVPQSYLSFVGGTTYNFDTNQFRLDLRALEATIAGMAEPITHLHNTEYVLSGVSYARSIEIIDPYTVEFEDGQYVVVALGSNNNIADVKVANQVSLITNNSGGLINSEAINDQSFLGGKIFINKQGLGTPGVNYPQGTPTSPVDNLSDAFFIANTRNLFGYNLKGVLVLDGTNASADITSSDFISSSPIEGIIVFDGRDITGATFIKTGITGDLNGRASYESCALGGPSGTTGVQGIFTDCGFNGNLELDSTATENILFKDCVSVIAGSTPVEFDCNGALSNIQFRNYSGGLNIINFNAGNNMSLDVNTGTITLDSSCTSGTIVVRGVVKLIDNSGVGCTVITEGTVTELVGAGGGAGEADWTNEEKKQIRDAMGVDGDKKVARGGQLQEKSESPSNNTINTNIINENDLN